MAQCSSLSLLSLPGEIRNQIFMDCIQHTSQIGFSNQVTTFGLGQDASFTRTNGKHISTNDIEINVLPRWSGQVKVRVVGIKSLPLLFVNRQISVEVTSLIDSMVSKVTIGPHGIQFANEDPNVRWDMAYQVLRNRPYLMKSIRTVEVTLPWLRADLFVLLRD